MSNLMRFNRLFGDTLFDDFFRPLAHTSTDKAPAIDVHETDESYLIKADLPGVSKDDISVKLENGILTLSAETHSENKEEEDGKLIRQERHFGQFIRQLSVGSDIDPSAVKANFVDGVLKVTLPKVHQEPPKGVDIDVN